MEFEHSSAGSDLGGGPGLREVDGSRSRADSAGDGLTPDELRIMNDLSADAEPDDHLQRQNGISLRELPARILHADLGRYEQVWGAAMRSQSACRSGSRPGPFERLFLLFLLLQQNRVDLWCRQS